MRALRLVTIGALLAAGAAPLHARKQPAPPPPQQVDVAEIERAVELRRYDQAKAMVERAKQAQQVDPRIDLALAEYWLATGRSEPALAAFARLTTAVGVGARAWQGRGIAAFRLGRFDEADASLRAAVAADAGLHRAWTALAATADNRADWEVADRAYAEALARSPEPGVVRLNRGYSLMMRRRYADAIPDLTAAVAALPGSEIAQNNLRLALALSGRYEEAFSGADKRQLYRQLNNVGYAALIRGDLQAAESYFNRAIEISDVFYQPAHRNLVYLEGLRRVASAPTTKPDERQP